MIGTGGVGLAAVQVAKAVGARVVAVGRNPAKLAAPGRVSTSRRS